MSEREYRLKLVRGKWCVIFREGGKEHRRSTGTADKQLAESVLPNIIEALERPVHMTIESIWEGCRADKKAQGKKIALNMEYHIKAIGPWFGKKHPSAITIEDCRNYVKHRLGEGKKLSTPITELKHLRLAINWAVKKRWIDKGSFIEVPSDPPPRNRHLTRDEFKRLFENALMPHVKVALALMIGTAGRIEAILQLTWDRVDFDRAKIQLQDELTARRQKGRATVPMNRDLCAILRTAYDQRTCNHVVEHGSAAVKSVSKGFSNAAERAGIKDVSPHVIRHTAAVWMAESGIAMDEIAQYLGHADVSTTRRIYARYSPEHLQGAAESLNFF